VEHPPPWSAFRSTNYGYTTMHVHNSSHIHMQQIVAGTGSAEDDFWIVKTRHEKYGRKERERLKKDGTRVPLHYCHHPTHCHKKPLHRERKKKRASLVHEHL